MINHTMRDIAAKDRLTEAFFTLYAVRRLEEITINDITRQAGVNRGTFHLYYTDIADILHTAENQLQEVVSAMLAELLSYALTGTELPPGAQKIGGSPHHIGYLKTVLGKNGDPVFRDRLQQLTRELLLIQCGTAPDGLTETSAAGQADYIAGGILALFSSWLQRDCQPPFAQLGQILQRSLPPDMAQSLHHAE